MDIENIVNSKLINLISVLKSTQVKKTNLNLQLNYTNSPTAQDPGGIDAESVAANREQARDRNVQFDTGESVKQLKTGMALQWNPSRFKVNSFAYYSYRDFANKLPFEFGGAVDLVRNYWGHGSNLSFDVAENKGLLKAQVGYELASQNDRRTRFVNNSGELGATTLQQNEIFKNFGAFTILQSTINNWNFRGGLRYDHNILKVEDSFIENGDASDKIVLNTFNPSIGFRYKFHQNHSLFTNFATSFETPVLSELSADPENNGGFNQNLEEQTSSTFEIGYALSKSNFVAEATLFYIETEGDIVPFELEAFPDRTFYRNAGSTERIGIEVNATLFLGEQFTLNTAYTWSNFTYSEFEIPSGNFTDNELPGIPEHLVSVQGTFQSKKGLVLRLDTQYRGDFYANDANLVSENAAFISNLSASQEIRFAQFTLKPFLGINNLFNTEYNDNIRVNAFGGRHFEPAPKFNLYGGLRLLMD